MSPEAKAPEKPVSTSELEELKARLAAAEARAAKAEAATQDSLDLAKSAMARLETAEPVKEDLGPPVNIKAQEDMMIPGRNTVVKAGEIVSVPEKLAEQICKVHEGQFSFSGIRPDAQTVRHSYTKAVRVA